MFLPWVRDRSRQASVHRENLRPRFPFLQPPKRVDELGLSSAILLPSSVNELITQSLKDSETIEEGHHALISLGRQLLESRNDSSSLSSMPADGISNGVSAAVMEENAALAQTPQRHGSDLVASSLPPILDNPIASPDVMQKKIAVRVNGKATQSGRDRISAPINEGSRRRRNKCGGVADPTTCACKRLLTLIQCQLT